MSQDGYAHRGSSPATSGQVLGDNNQGAIVSFAKSNDFGAEMYDPTITSSGAGVIAKVGLFAAHYIKDSSGALVTIVRGTFHFTRAAAGVAETLTLTLPAGAQPVANFAATTDATGSAAMEGLHAATDFCTAVAATVGQKKVNFACTDNAASSDINVCFSYKTA